MGWKKLFEKFQEGCLVHDNLLYLSEIKIVSEYDQEIPQSQTADNPVASREKHLWVYLRPEASNQVSAH